MTVPIPVAELPRCYQIPSAPPLINITHTPSPQSPIHWTFSQTERYEQLPPQIFEETEKNSPENVPGKLMIDLIINNHCSETLKIEKNLKNKDFLTNF